MASIAETIQSMRDHTREAYDAIAEKGGQLPAELNLDNLAEAIETITGGGSTDYGTLELTTGEEIQITDPLEYVKLGTWSQDEWSGPSAQNIMGQTIQPSTVKAYTFGPAATQTPNNFMSGISSLQELKGVENLTSIGNGFLNQVRKAFTFDEFTNVKFIGNNFLNYNTEFNSALSFPALEEIGDNFMGNNSSFNQPLDFPKLKKVGSMFMSWCNKFNSKITLPVLETAGTSFWNNVTLFNQPLELPSLTTVGNSFFYNGGFNNTLSLPKLTTIGTSFMSGCNKFNQPLDISKVKDIPDNFLSQSRNYNAQFNSTITFHPQLNSIGRSFLSYQENFNQPINIPSTVKTIGNSFLEGCIRFNSTVNIPSTVELDGGYFLNGDAVFNQPLTLPSAMKKIDSMFMGGCTAFNQPLTIPAGVTTFSGYFMQNCDNFVGPLTVETSAVPASNNQSLSVTSTTVPAYATGVTIDGPYASTWIETLPNRTSSPYRKLIKGLGPVEKFKQAVQNGTAESEYPAGTAVGDWTVANYLKSSNNSSYGGAEGAILILTKPTVLSQFGTGQGYVGSTQKSYLDNEFANTQPDDVKDNVSELSIPCYDGSTIQNVTCKWFAPSATELYSNSTSYQEGVAFAYFANMGGSSPTKNGIYGRAGQNGGKWSQGMYWSRSSNAEGAYMINVLGAMDNQEFSEERYVKACCFISKN